VSRPLILRLLVILSLASILPLAAPIATAAQTRPPAPSPSQSVIADRQAAAAAARELSRLEETRAFDTIYDRLYPDVKALVPRAALVGWYTADFTAKRTAELTVTSVAIADWTWPVTGRVYPNAAAVSYVQPYWIAGVRSDVSGVVHLVKTDRSDHPWAWFFGTDQASVEAQIATYAPNTVAPAFAESEAAQRPQLFPNILDADVDRFWASEFAAAGRRYNPPDGVVGFDKPVLTACGRTDPRRDAAFYCPRDETIYYSDDFRTALETQVGDFGWEVVVAHEWGHHVQFQLGMDIGDGGQLSALNSGELEQQADCLAGAYTEDAELTGWLDPGDVEEAIQVTGLAGDPVGTPFDDPYAHGTGQERVDAFLNGYQGGLSSCDLDL